MRARIETRLCTGCGRCEDHCPEVFEVSAGAATVRVERVPTLAEGPCLEAMLNCTQRAIRIKGLAGGLFPRWTSDCSGPAVALGLPGMIWCEPARGCRARGTSTLSSRATARVIRQKAG